MKNWLIFGKGEFGTMANYCEYEIHVKGSKKAVLMFFSTMPYMDYNEIYISK